MSVTEDFLRAQQQELQSELEKAKNVLESAQREVSRLEERLLYCQELLSKMEKGKADRRKERTLMVGDTTATLVERIIKKDGPRTVPELAKDLEVLGKITTTNSLYTILNRQKGKRFDKNEEGRWFLVSEQQNDPGLTQNRLIS